MSKTEKIPSGWAVATLSDVTNHHSGNSKLIKGKLFSRPGGGLLPAYSATGQDVWRNGFEEEGSAVIVSAVGARCGKCFLAYGKWSAIANTHVVRPVEQGIDVRFLWYRLNNERFWIRSGSAQPFVAVTKTLERDFVLPPLAEQHRIVEKIEELLSEVEASIKELESAQKKLKLYRASVLSAACSGKLVPTEAELARKENRSYETGTDLLARILKERREKWNGRGKYLEPKSVDSKELPTLPEGWIWARAEQLCGFITKGTTPSAEKLHSGNGEVPYIKVYNLTFSGSLDFSNKPTFIDRTTHEKELGRSRVIPGDVLMNIVGPPLGKVSIVPESYPEWNINQAVAIFRSLGGYDRHFLALSLLNEAVLSWAVRRSKATAGQFNLTLETCRDIPLPLPPAGEQVRIAKEVGRRISIVEEMEEMLSANLVRATRLHQSILEQAFSGKLVPQDPNDEPASVLLEKIKAEREKATSAKKALPKVSNGRKRAKKA